jgi:hypothetical protein
MFMTHFFRSLLISTLFSVSVGAMGSDNYSIRILPTFPDSGWQGLSAINDNRVVAGEYLVNGVDHLMTWTDGIGLRELGSAPNSFIIASSIGNSGSIAGSYINSPGTAWHGYFRSPAGNFQDINFPGADSTFVTAMTLDEQKVYGEAFDQNFHLSSFFSYEPGSQTYLPISAPENFGQIYGANIHGQIVGLLFYINSTNQINTVGIVIDTANGNQFTYSPIGVDSVMFWGINDQGFIVGSEMLDGRQVGIYGSIDSGFQVLDIPGADRVELVGVNNHQEIVGNYFVGSNVIGFLAIPIPEPSEFTLIVCGLLARGVLGVGRRGLRYRASQLFKPQRIIRS